jgi:O-antigen ligase
VVVWAVGLAYVVVGDSLMSTAGEAATMGRSGGGVTEMSGRMPLWTELMEYVEENPILGYGFGGFWTAEHVAEIAAKEGWVVTSAHSAYMECLLGTGVPGCFFYSALFLGALIAAVVQYRRTDRAETGFIACTLLYCMVHGSMEAAMATVPQFATLIVFAAVFVLAFDPTSPADRNADRGSRAASNTGPVQRLVWSA